MKRVLRLAALLACAALPASAQVADLRSKTELRVCADPAAVPMSAEDGSGFENRIATLFGEKLGLPVSPYRFVDDQTQYREAIAAISVGVVNGVPMLDLDYNEDSGCDTDMNVVMTGAGGFVEIQGTAEGTPFSGADLTALLSLAQKGIGELVEAQKRALTV